MRNLLVNLWILCAVTFVGQAAEKQTQVVTNLLAEPIQIAGIHNAFRVTTNLYSGSQPEGDASFAILAKLGIKTIVSVDGSRPDLASAKKWGLRYVHLPLGYDGIATNRVVELAKLVASGEGPFFVHCHHGKARGPAAVALMCEASHVWTPDAAIAWMHQAGTSDDYPGLYRAAREFKTPSIAELGAVKDLPESTQTTSLVEAMVELDKHFELLKKSQAAGWNPLLDHADAAPANEATIVWESLREIKRLPDQDRRSRDLQKMLATAEAEANKLRLSLRQTTNSVDWDSALKRVEHSCVSCHKIYRNE